MNFNAGPFSDMNSLQTRGFRGGSGEDPICELGAGLRAGRAGCSPNCSPLEPSATPRPACLAPASSRLPSCSSSPSRWPPAEAAPGAGDADPAKAVPAGTAIYLEGVVRPEGDAARRRARRGAARSSRTGDPEAKLQQLIDEALAQSDDPGVDLREGHRAVARAEGRRLDQRRRPRQARLRGARRDEGHRQGPGGDRQGQPRASKSTQRSYHGVDYQVDKDGVAAGIVGDFFTVGTEPEFKRTVDAHDGDSLADDKRYTSSDRRARRRPDRELLRRPQAVHRAGAEVGPERRGPAGADPRDLPASTSSSRSAARCWPTATGSRSTR